MMGDLTSSLLSENGIKGERPEKSSILPAPLVYSLQDTGVSLTSLYSSILKNCSFFILRNSSIFRKVDLEKLGEREEQSKEDFPWGLSEGKSSCGSTLKRELMGLFWEKDCLRIR